MKRILNAKKIKALALDLDGTTLLPTTELGERTARCLKKLMAGGIQIIFATGRAIEAAERYRAALDARGPMVFFNGVEVVDVPGGEIISRSLLDLEAAAFGADIARSRGLHYQLYLPAGTRISGGGAQWEPLLIEKPCAESELYRRHTGITPVVQDLKTALAAPGLAGCIKAMFITEPENHDEIRQKFFERFGNSIYMVRSTPTFFEIMSAGVSKGRGLETAMRRRGLEPEEVIAFGDEENDLSMFSVAGFAAAPANAKENVKAQADCIYGPCAEEGLAAWLEENFL
jgi:Cof subfamily protein (haloacid dehalogenase superfamily)